MNDEEKQDKTFDVGTKVEIQGDYVCAPCGYEDTFKQGDIFPPCNQCMQGQKYKGDDYFQDLGLWELKKAE